MLSHSLPPPSHNSLVCQHCRIRGRRGTEAPGSACSTQYSNGPSTWHLHNGALSAQRVPQDGSSWRCQFSVLSSSSSSPLLSCSNPQFQHHFSKTFFVTSLPPNHTRSQSQHSFAARRLTDALLSLSESDDFFRLSGTGVDPLTRLPRIVAIIASPCSLQLPPANFLIACHSTSNFFLCSPHHLCAMSGLPCYQISLTLH